MREYTIWLSQHTEKEIRDIFGHYPITYAEWSAKLGKAPKPVAPGVAKPSVAPTTPAPSAFTPEDTTNLEYMNSLRALMGLSPLTMDEYKGGQTEVAGGQPVGVQDINYDEAGNEYVRTEHPITGEVSWIPTGKYDASKDMRKKEPSLIPQPEGNVPTDPYGRGATWDADNGEWRYPPNWGVDPVTLSGGYISPYQQQMLTQQERERAFQEQTQMQNLAWQKEQEAGRLVAEKQQRLAQLGAQPISWLQYAAEAQQPPVIQPWMLPLQERDYGWRVGQPIPGYTPENMTGMPTLTTPSRQYQARMGPTAEQQYLGYQQAQQGALPQETQWRLWSFAPPSGQFTGFRR